MHWKSRHSFQMYDRNIVRSVQRQTSFPTITSFYQLFTSLVYRFSPEEGKYRDFKCKKAHLALKGKRIGASIRIFDSFEVVGAHPKTTQNAISHFFQFPCQSTKSKRLLWERACLKNPEFWKQLILTLKNIQSSSNRGHLEIIVFFRIDNKMVTYLHIYWLLKLL